jgi:hypothetical protein
MRETRTAAEKGEAKKRAARRRGMTLAEYEAMRARDRATRAEARELRIRKHEQAEVALAAGAAALAADTGEGTIDQIADRVLRQQLIAAEVRAAGGLPGPDDAALARTLAGRRVTQRQEVEHIGERVQIVVIRRPLGQGEALILPAGGEGGALEADFAELPSDATPAEGSVGQPEQGASGEAGEEG